MVQSTHDKYDRILNDLEEERRQRDRVVNVDEKRHQLVVFSIARYLFAISGSHVRTILPVKEIIPVPGTPQEFPGVIHVRGQIYSVLSLHRLFGWTSPEVQSSNRIAIIAHETIETGIFMDAVENVLSVAERTLGLPLSTLDEPVRSVVDKQFFFDDGRPVSIVNIPKLFDLVEQGVARFQQTFMK
ncbi:MAG: chemotaxis protein CheW [Nitrospirae bacterium]|nr:chemotaxis protein CheW [Magnetococcales bacterium]